MKFKKLLSLSTAFLVSASILTGCGSNKGTEKNDISVGIVLGAGSINDQSFNQSTWEGLQKAKADFGIEIKYLESKQESDYIQNIETLMDEDTDLIIGVGYQLKDSIEESAKNYPEQKFAILDETYDTIQENVIPVVFKEEESAYLVGVMAAKMSKTNKVGFIGGLPAPSVVRHQYGYKYGVTNTNKDTQILEQYVNSFTDQAKGKSIAKQMQSSNADIILAAAGDSGTGAIEAAKEANKYAIGVDRDQSDLAPENVLTSAVKKLNVASYDLVKDLVEGTFKGGAEKVYGLKEGGVGIVENTKNLIPQDVMDYVNKEANKVKNGEIKIPKTEEEYNQLQKQKLDLLKEEIDIKNEINEQKEILFEQLQENNIFSKYNVTSSQVRRMKYDLKLYKKQLLCPLCKERICEVIINKPKSNCCHSFCKRCVESLNGKCPCGAKFTEENLCNIYYKP